MTLYLLRQLIVVFPLTLLGAVTLVFLIIHLVPGDPVVSIMQDYFTQASYDQVRRNLGLDRPLHVQYVDYLRGLLHLDFGTSFSNRRPVIENIAEQFPYTLHLAIASILIAVLIALPTGIIAAVYRNRWPDYLSMMLALLAISSPLFVTGIVLVLVFSLYLGWFPSFGVGGTASFAVLLAHLVLPATAQGARSAALLARVTRSTFLDTMTKDYIRTARAKGLRERTVVLRHAARNALIPIVTVIGMDVAYLLGGAVVIETVFSRQGVGRLLLNAILTRDYPQIQGTLLFFIGITILVNTLVDIVYGLIDPRIRYG